MLRLQNRFVTVRKPGSQPAHLSKVLGAGPKSLVLTLPFTVRQDGVDNFWPSQDTELLVSPREGDGGHSAEAVPLVCRVKKRRLKPLPLLVLSAVRDIPVGEARGWKKRERGKMVLVASGKGGTGKTFTAVNLAVLLGRRFSTVLMDVDLGTGNAALNLGFDPPHSIRHVIRDKRPVEQVAENWEAQLKIVAGSSGRHDIADLSVWDFARLLDAAFRLQIDNRMLLLDAQAGITNRVRNFALVADELLLVTNPTGPAIMDAYALIKALHRTDNQLGIKLIFNRVRRPEQAKRQARRLVQAVQRFLDFEVSVFGFLPFDRRCNRAVNKRVPFVKEFPTSTLTRELSVLADGYEEELTAGQRGPKMARSKSSLW